MYPSLFHFTVPFTDSDFVISLVVKLKKIKKPNTFFKFVVFYTSIKYDYKWSHSVEFKIEKPQRVQFCVQFH